MSIQTPNSSPSSRGITRWKGQLAGVDVLAQLLQRGVDVALLLVGEVKDGKDGFRQELKREPNRWAFKIA